MPTYPLQMNEGQATRFQYGVTNAGRVLSGVADAIGFVPGSANYMISGNWWITTGSADAITLAAPISGGGFAGASGAVFPNMQGNDEFELNFYSTTAFAHTITTPLLKINGSLHIATFGAAVGNNITFVAHAGVWYVQGAPVGVTLS
jgi:hypothetical protein